MSIHWTRTMTESVHLLLTAVVLSLSVVTVIDKSRTEQSLARAEATIADQNATLEAYREYDLQNMPPFLHYDHGAGAVYVAMSPSLAEVEDIHEYVVNIFRREAPHNPLEWEAHIVDHGLDCYEGVDTNIVGLQPCGEAISRYGAFSVVAPGLSMPAMDSLCGVLKHYYGWAWPHESKLMPEAVRKAASHPGQADLMCVWTYYHRQELPWWFWDERRWQDLDIGMVERPEQVLDWYGMDEEDWGDSPWRKPPKTERL